MWPYSCCLWGVAPSTKYLCVAIILVFSFSIRFVGIQVIQPYSSTNMATVWKGSRFILSDTSDSHMVDNLSVAVHVLPMCMLTWLSVDEMLLLYQRLCRFSDYTESIIISMIFTFALSPYCNRGSPCGVVANVLDCDIMVYKFELQSRYYVHF